MVGHEATPNLIFVATKCFGEQFEEVVFDAAARGQELADRFDRLLLRSLIAMANRNVHLGARLAAAHRFVGQVVVAQAAGCRACRC